MLMISACLVLIPQRSSVSTEDSSLVSNQPYILIEKTMPKRMEGEVIILVAIGKFILNFNYSKMEI